MAVLMRVYQQYNGTLVLLLMGSSLAGSSMNPSVDSNDTRSPDPFSGLRRALMVAVRLSNTTGTNVVRVGCATKLPTSFALDGKLVVIPIARIKPRMT
jgi:hypothetical protein